MWKLTHNAVEGGIQKLNQHLNHPAVRKTLAALKIDNPWKYLADNIRTLKGQLTVAALISVFDKVIGVLNDLLDLVKKWGSAAMNTQARQLLLKIKRVRDQANAKLAKALKPVQDWLDKLAKRLDVEAEKSYPAATRAMNPHSYKVPEATELAEFEKKKPEWVERPWMTRYTRLPKVTPTRTAGRICARLRKARRRENSEHLRRAPSRL